MRKIRNWTLWRWSTTSKTQKERAGGAEASIVEASAPNDRKRKRGLHRVLLGTSAYKEGAVAMVGEWSPQPGKNPQEETPSQKEKEDVASVVLGRKRMVIHL
jgi:hypothetical protein